MCCAQCVVHLAWYYWVGVWDAPRHPLSAHAMEAAQDRFNNRAVERWIKLRRPAALAVKGNLAWHGMSNRLFCAHTTTHKHSEGNSRESQGCSRHTAASSLMQAVEQERIIGPPGTCAPPAAAASSDGHRPTRTPILLYTACMRPTSLTPLAMIAYTSLLLHLACLHATELENNVTPQWLAVG